MKLLVITHDVYAPIPEEEVYDTLKKYYGDCHFELVSFENVSKQHGDFSSLYWQTLKSEQERWYTEEILPRIKKNAGNPVVYFGLAPIPLCMHLGYLMGGVTNVDVFMRHHDNKDWHWTGTKAPELPLTGVPGEKFHGKGDVVIQLSTYSKINAADTEKVVRHPMRTIQACPEHTDRDLLGTMDDTKAYAKVFFDALKRINELLPETEYVHLFAAVPCGLAFLMGTEIQPNVHKPIVVYHYVVTQDPPYIEAFSIQEEVVEMQGISEENKERIQEFRLAFKEHFDKDIRFFLKQQQEDKRATHWFKAVCPNQEANGLFHTRLWSELPKIDQTILPTIKFSESPDGGAGNHFFSTGEWHLPEELIYGWLESLDVVSLKTIVRMFWFREAVHFKVNGVHSDNASGLSRYPSVLEKAEYQSDVYALLHEYAFDKRNAFQNEPGFFGERIEVLIKTLYVLESSARPHVMETRIVKRLLIWFFQWVRIEDAGCQSMEDVLEILSVKPEIDIRLNLRIEDSNKVQFNLRTVELESLGISFYYKGKVHVYGRQDGQISLENIPSALMKRDLNQIKPVMRQLLVDMNRKG